MAMQYVFNPRNRQINPVTPQTFVDSTLRDKVVSPALYALVCKGKISVEDIAALFAVNKSPEILLKNYTAVKESVTVTAPDNKETVTEDTTPPPPPPGSREDEADGKGTADAAFDGRELTKKTQADLLILATTVGIDVNAEGFAPTRSALIKAIMAKAKAAEGGTPAAQ